MRGPGTGAVGTGARFTYIAVPRFHDNGCWQQHLQIFNVIHDVKRLEGRDGGAAAVCALGGGVTQCGPSDVGRGTCQPGGTVAGSLEQLQLTGKTGGVPEEVRHGTRDFGGSGIWRYGYSLPEPNGPGQFPLRINVPPDTPIREIVDRCRVWESHSKQKRGSSPAADGHPKCKGVPSNPWEYECGKDSLREEPRTPVSGANVVWDGRGESQKKGSGCSRECCPL